MNESLGPVVCRWNDCNNKYISPEELSKHLDFQHDLSDWICHWTSCRRNLKPFDARYKLIVHLRCHTGEKPYKCTIPGCVRTFSRSEYRRIHMRTHTGEKPYACTYKGCCESFYRTSARAKHIKTHNQVIKNPYKCDYPGCDKHYMDPSSTRRHLIHSENAKQNKTNLRIHVNSPVLPTKQPRLVVSNNTTVPPANNIGMTDASQVTSNNNGNNNGNNNLSQVLIFQLLPRDNPLPGQSNMSQLIQEGKIQPILLKNGDQQSMLMFVPTANMHEAAGPGVTMIPVLPQTSQPQQQQSNSTPHNTSTQTTTSNKMADTTEQPVRPAKNVHVIVSSGKTRTTDNSESSTSSSSYY